MTIQKRIISHTPSYNAPAAVTTAYRIDGRERNATKALQRRLGMPFEYGKGKPLSTACACTS